MVRLTVRRVEWWVRLQLRPFAVRNQHLRRDPAADVNNGDVNCFSRYLLFLLFNR